MGPVLSSRLASLLMLQLGLLRHRGLLVLILRHDKWRPSGLPDSGPLWSLWLELLLVDVWRLPLVRLAQLWGLLPRLGRRLVSPRHRLPPWLLLVPMLVL